MEKSHLIGAMCTCLAFVSLNAYAAVVTYDESIDGDIGGFPYPKFNFDVGVNVISGNITTSRTARVITTDSDSFDFSLDSNLILTNIEFAYENVAVSGINKIGDKRFLNGDLALTTIFNIAGATDPSLNSIFSTFLPLGAGDHTFASGMKILSGISGDYSGSWDYTLRFTVVSTVPIPGAVWLFGSGLLGLIGIARRKKA